MFSQANPLCSVGADDASVGPAILPGSPGGLRGPGRFLEFHGSAWKDMLGDWDLPVVSAQQFAWEVGVKSGSRESPRWGHARSR